MALGSRSRPRGPPSGLRSAGGRGALARSVPGPLRTCLRHGRVCQEGSPLAWPPVWEPGTAAGLALAPGGHAAAPSSGHEGTLGCGPQLALGITEGAFDLGPVPHSERVSPPDQQMHVSLPPTLKAWTMRGTEGARVPPRGESPGSIPRTPGPGGPAQCNRSAQHPPQDGQGQGQAGRSEGAPGRASAGGDRGASDLHCQCPCGVDMLPCTEEAAASGLLWRESTHAFPPPVRRWLLIASCWRRSRFCRKSWNLSSRPRTQESSCPGVGCHLVDTWGVAALCHPQLWLCLLLHPPLPPSSSSPPVAYRRLKPKKCSLSRGPGLALAWASSTLHSQLPEGSPAPQPGGSTHALGTLLASSPAGCRLS